MQILEAFDLTRCSHSAAELVGVDEKTVARYVAIRDAGRNPFAPPRRPRGIDSFLDKIEELVEASQGQVQRWRRRSVSCPRAATLYGSLRLGVGVHKVSNCRPTRLAIVSISRRIAWSTVGWVPVRFNTHSGGPPVGSRKSRTGAATQLRPCWAST